MVWHGRLIAGGLAGCIFSSGHTADSGPGAAATQQPEADGRGVSQLQLIDLAGAVRRMPAPEISLNTACRIGRAVGTYDAQPDASQRRVLQRVLPAVRKGHRLSSGVPNPSADRRCRVDTENPQNGHNWHGLTQNGVALPYAGKTGGPVAQRTERRTHNPTVAGSNPAGPSLYLKRILSGAGRLCRLMNLSLPPQ